jgi:hypothetical protein
MENEKKSDRQMCDWCGNEYGRKYKWWRLILAIVIGLFIFLAGIQIGEMRIETLQQYGGHMGGMMNRHMMYQGGYGMNTVMPSNPVMLNNPSTGSGQATGTTTTSAPMIPAPTPAQ